MGMDDKLTAVSSKLIAKSDGYKEFYCKNNPEKYPLKSMEKRLLKNTTLTAENITLNKSYKVETVIKDESLIYQDVTDLHGEIIRYVADLKEQGIKNALISLGWTPPNGNIDDMALEIGRLENINKELLGALEELLNVVDGCHTQDWLERKKKKAYAAIKKARGES